MHVPVLDAGENDKQAIGHPGWWVNRLCFVVRCRMGVNTREQKRFGHTGPLMRMNRWLRMGDEHR